jgi:hypothetical protein
LEKEEDTFLEEEGREEEQVERWKEHTVHTHTHTHTHTHMPCIHHQHCDEEVLVVLGGVMALAALLPPVCVCVYDVSPGLKLAHKLIN